LEKSSGEGILMPGMHEHMLYWKDMENKGGSQGVGGVDGWGFAIDFRSHSIDVAQVSLFPSHGVSYTVFCSRSVVAQHLGHKRCLI